MLLAWRRLKGRRRREHAKARKQLELDHFNLLKGLPKGACEVNHWAFFSLIFEPATAAFITCEMLVMLQVTAAVVKAWISC